mmetsp:Transcript_43228/g.84934  ORF Transcript_43228/g.84934 Transcript_43228/m.84934 type:complete len:582 (-) Transcript_43228:201-1946(-)
MDGGAGRGGVEVDQRLDISADTVVEASRGVAVDEAVAHPPSGGDGVGHLVEQLEGSVHAVLRHRASGGGDGRGVVGQDVGGVFTRQQDHIARFAPVDRDGIHVNLLHEIPRGEIVKENRLGTPGAQQRPPEDPLGGRHRGPHRGVLRKIFKDLDGPDRLPDSVIAGARAAPHEIERGPERLVAQRLRGVDNKLPVPAHRHEAPVAIVRNGLRIELTRAQIARRHLQRLPVRHALAGARQALHAGGANVVVGRPHDPSRRVHARHGVVAPEFHHHASLVEPDRQFVRAGGGGEGPGALHAVVEGVLLAVGGALPDADGAVLPAARDEGEARVEDDGAHVVRVSLEGVHDRFGLVVPDLDAAVVRPREEVGTVAGGVVVDAVHAAFVALQRVVVDGAAEAPHLDGAVQRGGGERVRVLGVEPDHHDVVRVALEVLRVLPVALPVPQFHAHIVTRTQDVRQRGMHLQITNVVAVRLELTHLLGSVVIINTQSHVVRRRDEPLPTADEFRAADRQVGELERFHHGGRLVVPDHHIAGVEGREGPGLRLVEVHGFHAFRRGGQLLADVHIERHLAILSDRERIGRY